VDTRVIENISLEAVVSVENGEGSSKESSIMKFTVNRKKCESKCVKIILEGMKIVMG